MQINWRHANLEQVEHKFSIIVLTETWTKPEMENWVDIPGYSKIIKSRIGMKGGGVALFLNNNLDICWNIRPDLSLRDSREMESLFIQIKQTKLSTKDIIVGVIYRPPNTDFEVFYNNFSEILTKIGLEKRPTYLLGDFNIDLLKYGNELRTQKFINLLLSNGFYPRIDRPTRLTDTSATLIDQIFVNVHTDNIISGPWLVDIADHLPVYITLPYEPQVKTYKFEHITKRRYVPEKLLASKNELSKTDWFSVSTEVDVNNKFNKFISIFENLHNKYFPIVRIKLKTNTVFKPWITHAIKNSVKKKNNLYKIYIREKSSDLRNAKFEKYKKYKNKLTKIIRASEKQYYQKKLLDVKDNMSRTWKLLNSMLYRNIKCGALSEMEINGKLVNDKLDIANNFNNFFTNIGPNLASKISKTNANYNQFLKGTFQNSFFPMPVTNNEISMVINNLKNSNSKGYDNIPVHLIKYCSIELSDILAHINNESLNTGVFPDLLKIAKIIPMEIRK